MKISVVIPVYNAQGTILDCLQSLNGQEELPYEVILVDNNSTDGTIKKIEENLPRLDKLKILIISESKKGPAAARNKGIRIARGEIVAFTDADCIVRKNWIKNILYRFDKDDKLIGIGGKVESYKPDTYVGKFISFFRKGEFLYKENPTKLDLLRNGTHLATLNSAYRREILFRYNLFDENYMVGEDLDLYLKIINDNNKVIAGDPNIVVYHIERRNIKAFVKRIVQYRLYAGNIIKRYFSNEIIILLPFNRLIHINCKYITVWIEAPLKLLVVFAFFVACVFFYKYIYYLLLTIFLLGIINILFYLRKIGSNFTFKDLPGIIFLSFLQSLISELTKVYASLRYRLIYL